MAKFKDIINGWRAYSISDETTQEIAKKRAKICASCDKPVKGVFEFFLPDFEIKEIQGLKCSVCNCPLSTATRSKNYSCPLNKW
jgi:hypothetical protein